MSEIENNLFAVLNSKSLKSLQVYYVNSYDLPELLVPLGFRVLLECQQDPVKILHIHKKIEIVHFILLLITT